MLTLPTDHPLTNVNSLRMEPFSHLNATPVTCTNTEYSYRKGPPNIVSNIIAARGINNLLNIVGFDISNASGDNGFYGKSYQLAEGDTHFPLIDIPRAPLHSLVELTGANVGTRLLEPTHAIGNSWKPPYIPTDGIYADRETAGQQTSINDVSWQLNDALFDRYYPIWFGSGVWVFDRGIAEHGSQNLSLFCDGVALGYINELLWRRPQNGQGQPRSRALRAQLAKRRQALSRVAGDDLG